METKLHRWYRVNEDWLLFTILLLTPIVGIYLLFKTSIVGVVVMINGIKPNPMVGDFDGAFK